MPNHCVVLIPPTIGSNAIAAGIHGAPLVARIVGIEINVIGSVDREIESPADIPREAFRRRMTGIRIISGLNIRLFKTRRITTEIFCPQLQRRRIFLDRHAEISACTPAVAVAVVVIELRAFNRDGSRELIRMLLRDDVHDAAHGVRTPDGGCRSADHFDAFDGTHGRHKDAPRIKTVVDHAAGSVLLAAVNENQRIRGAEAADRNVGCAHLIGGNIHARDVADSGTEIRHRFRCKFLFRNHGDACGRLTRVLRIAGSGNNRSIKSGVVVISGEGGRHSHRKRQHDERFAVVVHSFRSMGKVALEKVRERNAVPAADLMVDVHWRA